MKQQFLVDKTGTISLTVKDKNRPVIPSAATITLTKPNGSDLQTEVAVTAIDATTGEMTYSLTASHNDDHDLNYKAVWKYTVSGVDYYRTQLYDVVKSILAVTIDDSHIHRELPSLRDSNEQAVGTVESATDSTIVDVNGRKEDDDFWKGGIIEVVAGTGDGQKRVVTGSTQSSGTISVTPDWGTNPDSTSEYKIVRSWYNAIQASFEKLQTMIYNLGKRHSLILESSQVEVPHIYLTIHFIALDLMKEEGDKWDLIATRYWDKFQASFDTMQLEYDEDESGSIDEEEEQSQVAGVRIGRT